MKRSWIRKAGGILAALFFGTSGLMPALVRGAEPVAPSAKPAPVFEAWPFDAAEAGRRQKATAEALGIPAELTLNVSTNQTLRLVLIPAGKFMMGSPESEPGRFADEGPRRMVTITRPFYLGATAVTDEQYEALTGRKINPFHPPGCPANAVTWDQAVAFCQRLGHDTGRIVRLPTEAEWEYACRAGTDTAYHTGDTLTQEQADFGEYDQYFLPKEGKIPYPWVGRFSPNAWGLYDMHGNIWEWCADWYAADTYQKGPSIDPQGPDDGRLRVLRGGSYMTIVGDCRSAMRDATARDVAGVPIGFRLVVEVEVP